MRRSPIIALAGAAVLAAGYGSGSASPATGAKGCTKVSPPAMGPHNEKKPTEKLDAKKVYVVTMKTNCGSFSFRIDQKQSPNDSASFVTLVQRGFFNDTLFHRIVPGFVIQGGDPTGTGGGGPGYTTVDKPPANAAYLHGVVAMAKTPTAPNGTAGSQFFVVTEANAGLPPQYAIIGKVVSGLNVVDLIGTLGNPNTQQPTQTVEIEQATVKTLPG